MCETYNGWKNRETWALNLWLENDQGLYEMTLERVGEYLALSADDTRDRQYAAHRAGEAVKELWGELTDPHEALVNIFEVVEMVKDVGSDYRVDWDEIGAAWLSSLDES